VSATPLSQRAYGSVGTLPTPAAKLGKVLPGLPLDGAGLLGLTRKRSSGRADHIGSRLFRQLRRHRNIESVRAQMVIEQIDSPRIPERRE
jgi:hypothetical protein